MRARSAWSIVYFWVLVMGASGGTAQTVYLDANFDEKPIDMPIGTWGPSFGEPVSVDPFITAIVRDTPMNSPCLELRDQDDYSAGFAGFEFLGGVEVTSGKIGLSAILWFTEISPGYTFGIYIRERGSAARMFSNLHFTASGLIYASDESSSYGIIGTYSTSRPFPFGIIYDMDAGTYDVWIDNNRVLLRGSHGIDDRGVGTIFFGCMHDPDLEGHFYVDDILVADYLPPVSSEYGTWGGVKALYR